jgi:putative nucleotidyltransferase with HDIG domain
MKTLTPKTAEEFAKKIFNEKMYGLEKDFITRHSKGVLKTCVKLSKGKKVDVGKLKVASWLHDIGRAISIKNHAKISVEIAEKEFGGLDEIIKDCILNHGNSGNPETKEGKIIQFADKLSILNDYELIKMIFSKEKYKEKSIGFIKMVCDDFLDILERYKW